MYPCWITPDEAVIRSIVFSAEELCIEEPETLVPTVVQRDAAVQAISVATDILAALTRGGVHGPGMAVDEYVDNGTIRRLSTQFRPLRDVVCIEVISACAEPSQIRKDWKIIGQTIFFTKVQNFSGSNACGDGFQQLRVTYRFGSTVTPAARAALLYYARQLFLLSPCGNPDECQLPERVVSVNREGLNLSMSDPMTFLDRGLTGLPRVDDWLSRYAGMKGTRPSAVYEPSSPPGVNIAVWCPDALPTTYESLEALQ